MNALTRALCLLLCLLLVAKGGVAAMLSPTGASGYVQPLADDCPLVGLAASAESDAAAVDGSDALPQQGAPAEGREKHRHHVLPLLSLSQAAVSRLIHAAPPAAGCPPVAATASYSSEVCAPLLHPPRQHA
jgi:hypothetical protein